jgi:hypothetical protein
MNLKQLNQLIESLKKDPIKNADLIAFYERKKRTIISDAISTAVNSLNQ